MDDVSYISLTTEDGSVVNFSSKSIGELILGDVKSHVFSIGGNKQKEVNVVNRYYIEINRSADIKERFKKATSSPITKITVHYIEHGLLSNKKPDIYYTGYRSKWDNKDAVDVRMALVTIYKDLVLFDLPRALVENKTGELRLFDNNYGVDRRRKYWQKHGIYNDFIYEER